VFGCGIWGWSDQSARRLLTSMSELGPQAAYRASSWQVSCAAYSGRNTAECDSLAHPQIIPTRRTRTDPSEHTTVGRVDCPKTASASALPETASPRPVGNPTAGCASNASPCSALVTPKRLRAQQSLAVSPVRARGDLLRVGRLTFAVAARFYPVPRGTEHRPEGHCGSAKPMARRQAGSSAVK
jgi:hypothetical protein